MVRIHAHPLIFSMTKYILIGGYPHKASDGGKAIYWEAIEGFPEPVNVLICLFAREQEQWGKSYDEKKQFFTKNLPKTKLNFTLAKEFGFVDQIKFADLLYFVGGDTARLIRGLERNPGWKKALESKTVMGSSAGADLLSTYNYDLEYFKCSSGSGLVPVKTIVHYESDNYTPPIGWRNAYKEIKKYKEDLPIWALHEGEYKTIKI